MWSELLASTYVELLYDGSSASDYWLTRWVEVNASAIFSADHESYAAADHYYNCTVKAYKLAAHSSRPSK